MKIAVWLLSTLHLSTIFSVPFASPEQTVSGMFSTVVSEVFWGMMQCCLWYKQFQREVFSFLLPFLIYSWSRCWIWSVSSSFLPSPFWCFGKEGQVLWLVCSVSKPNCCGNQTDSVIWEILKGCWAQPFPKTKSTQNRDTTHTVLSHVKWNLSKIMCKSFNSWEVTVLAVF